MKVFKTLIKNHFFPEKVARFKVPSLRMVYLVCQGVGQNKLELVQEYEAVLKHFLEEESNLEFSHIFY